MSLREEDTKLEAVLVETAVYNVETKQVVGSKTAYVDNLPEGITKDTVKAIRSYDRNFINATGLVTGSVGTDAMVKDEELAAVTSSWDMIDGNSINWTLKRESVGRNPKTGEEIRSKAALSPVFESKAGRTSKSASLGHVVSHVKSLGAVKLGNDK